MEVIAALLGGGGFGAAATALVRYLTGRRRMSGRVETSEAAQLWQEAREHREGLMRRVEALERQLERALGERAELLGMVEELQRELDSVRGELATVRIESRQKDEQIAKLRHENERLAGRVDELEREQVLRRAERPT